MELLTLRCFWFFLFREAPALMDKFAPKVVLDISAVANVVGFIETFVFFLAVGLFSFKFAFEFNWIKPYLKVILIMKY